MDIYNDRTRIYSSQYIQAKIAERDYSSSLTGQAYKVFRVKNGKLYPPMVDNIGGVDTPVGVWLEAEEGEFAGLSKTGRKQVKSSGGGTLAYRPGWHLGEQPRAKQFDRSFGWEFVDIEDGVQIDKTVRTYSSFIRNHAKLQNVGKLFYIQELDDYVQVVDYNAPYFPYDFVWALCDYVMDISYQDEATEYGYYRTSDDGTYKTNADGTIYRSDKF